MADIQDLQRRFPNYKIRSQPAPGCKCNDGVRKTNGGHEFPCLCVCMSAPEPGEDEYRPGVCKAVGEAARQVSFSGMKAISVRQPWAWLIVNGFKDIENRDWATKMRGRVLIHASKGMTRDEYRYVRDFVAGLALGRKSIPLDAYRNFPRFEDMQRGGIVGSVDIVDCVPESDSQWFFGRYGFVLANPEVLPFQPMKGALGFFKPTF